MRCTKEARRRFLVGAVVVGWISGCGPAGSNDEPETLYGQDVGLQCHQDQVEDAIYDYAEGVPDTGHNTAFEAMDEWWAAGDGAFVDESRRSRPDPEDEDGSPQTYLDEHGHAQLVVRVTNADSTWWVTGWTGCAS